MTLSETLTLAHTTLDTADIDNAIAEAEWIAAHVLGIRRAELHLTPGLELTGKQERRITDAVEQRRRRVPLQYILGDVPFCDCTIRVAPGVLIPRPETEWLVETLLEQMPADTRSVLDVGTGSGAIAVALAVRLPSATVTAVDLSPAAIRIARDNAKSSDVADRVRFCRADMRHLPFRDAAFDLILSNPPYIRSADIAELEPEVRDHEPMLALDGGEDGLRFYRALAQQARSLLAGNGRIAVELPGHPPGDIADLFQKSGFGSVDVTQDWAAKPRLLEARNLT